MFSNAFFFSADVSSSSHVFGSVEEGVARGLGCRVCWHDKLDTVPEGFTMMVANEFLDALPIHRFAKVGGEWKEILVDVNDKTPAYTDPAEVNTDVTPEQDQSKQNEITNANVTNKPNDTKSSQDGVTNVNGTNKPIEQDSKSNQDGVTNTNKPLEHDSKSNHDTNSNDVVTDVVKEDITSVTDNLALRFVLSRNQTPASIAFTQVSVVLDSVVFYFLFTFSVLDHLNIIFGQQNLPNDF